MEGGVRRRKNVRRVVIATAKTPRYEVVVGFAGKSAGAIDVVDFSCIGDK